MKIIKETQSTKRTVGDIINWGDQIDVVTRVSEPITVNDTTVYDVTFVRCTKQEYEATDIESIMEKAKNDEYNDVEFLRKKIENQAKAINILSEIMEEEDE